MFIHLTKCTTMNFNKFLPLFLFFALTGRLALAQADPLNPATWAVNPADFSETMIITGIIQVNNTEIQDGNYEIAAFVNGECRGVATPVFVPQLNRYLITLFVYSNGGNEEIEFWVHRTTSNVVLPVIDKLMFDSAVPVGTPANPYVFRTLQANVTFVKDDVLCDADDNGFATANVSFGNVNQDYFYTLNWSTGSTQKTISNLSAGTYYLTVTVENLFEFVDSVEIINLNRTIAKPNLLAAPSQNVCLGDDAFILAYTNETEQPKYNWFDIFDNQIYTGDVLSLPNMQANRLVYAQTEVRNCLSERSSISIEVYNVPNVNFLFLPRVGTVGERIRFFTGEPNTVNTVYRWNMGDGYILSNGGPQIEHTYEEAGVYRVSLRVTTSEGCTKEESKQISVLDPPPGVDDGSGSSQDPLIFGFNVNDALCSTDNTGSISTQVFNGVGTIRYAWSTGANTAAISGLSPGTYSVTITDGAGKSGIGTATVVAKYPGVIQAPDVIINGGHPVCESGNIWVAAITTLPEAEVYWYNTPTGSAPIFQGNPLILFNVQENSALYVETRAGGCASERVPVDIQVIQLYSEFEASATIAPAGLAIDFASIGFDPNQTYEWAFGDGNTARGNTARHIFNNPGIYEVKLTASFTDGCSETSSKIIRITERGALGVAFNVVDVLCADDTNGSISVEVATGTPPYSFAWSNDATGSILTDLGAGDYTVVITDAAGNIRTESVTVQAVNPPIEIPQVSINGGSVVCAGDNVILAAITNVADAEYRWYDAPVGGNLLYNGASYPILNIQETQEAYVEAFFNGCFSPGRASVLVQVISPDPTFTASSSVINEGGSISFNANVVVAGSQYAWDFGDGSIGSGPAVEKVFESIGLFTVTMAVIDSIGCTASSSQIIRVVSAADMVVSLAISNVACADDTNGSATATVFNGKPPFSFQWSTGAVTNTISNLAPGNYTLTVTDSDGQSRLETVRIVSETDVLPAPTIALFGSSFVCPNEAITIYAYTPQQSNLSYHWYDAAEDGNLLAVTNIFNVLGRDLPPNLFVESRSGGCRSDTRERANVSSELIDATFSASSMLIVEGNQITFTPNTIDSTLTYTWFFNDGNTSTTMSPTHTFLLPGNYRVRLDVLSANNCLDSRFLTVGVISTNETSLVLNTTRPACEGQATGAITAEVVNAPVPYTLTWGTGATGATVSGLAEGMYAVTFTDANGLSLTRTVELRAITPTPALPTIVTNAGSPICYQDNLLLRGSSADPSAGYLWYDDNDNLLGVGPTFTINSIAESGTIYLAAQKNGCQSARDSVRLQVQIPDASFSVSQNGLATVNEMLSFQPTVTTYPIYTWNFGDGNTSSQLNSLYAYPNTGVFNARLTVTDQDGCSNTFTREVDINPVDFLRLTFDVNDIPCTASEAIGGSITVTPGAGTPPYTYLWSNGATSPDATGLPVGSHTVTVTDAEGKVSTGTASITNRNIQLLPPVVTVNGNAPVCKGSDAFLLGRNAQFAQAQTLWFATPEATEPLSSSELLVLRALNNNRIVYVQSQIAACESVRIPLEVNVQAPVADFRVTPTPDIMEGQVVQFRLTEVNPNYSYYWKFGDNGWSGRAEPFYFYNVVGQFDVQLQVTDQDGCDNTIMKENLVTVRAMPSSGLQADEVAARSQDASGLDNSIQVAAFPNPFYEQLTVVLKVETTDTYRVALTDLLGRTHFVQEMEISAHTPQQLLINNSDLRLNNGIYLLRIENKHTNVIYKLLKQGF